MSERQQSIEEKIMEAHRKIVPCEEVHFAVMMTSGGVGIYLGSKEEIVAYTLITFSDFERVVDDVRSGRKKLFEENPVKQED